MRSFRLNQHMLAWLCWRWFSSQKILLLLLLLLTQLNRIAPHRPQRTHRPTWIRPSSRRTELPPKRTTWPCSTRLWRRARTGTPTSASRSPRRPPSVCSTSSSRVWMTRTSGWRRSRPTTRSTSSSAGPRYNYLELFQIDVMLSMPSYSLFFIADSD